MKLCSDWQIKRDETEFANIRNEIGNIMRDPIDGRRKIRESYNPMLIFSKIDEWILSLKNSLIEHTKINI